MLPAVLLLGICTSFAAAQNAPPRILQRQEPVYSDQATAARLEGTVLLSLVVDENGNARDIRVARPLGLGLDEKAVGAVKGWRFAPGTRDGSAVVVPIDVEVRFHLLADTGAWHLTRALLEAPEDATAPVLTRASYPQITQSRQGEVSVSFDINEDGLPIHVRVEHSSDAQLNDEVIALIREWRFAAAVRNGMPVLAHGVFDFRGSGPEAAVPAAAPRKR
jgi:TonB family protein